MAIVEHELIIHAAPSVVYEASQDYSVRYQWDPFPDSIQLLDEATTIAKGVRVRIVAKSGLTMDVEFVHVSPPETAAIIMTTRPIFLESFGGSWVFRPNGPRSTKARFRYAIKMKNWTFPPVSEVLAAWYFRRVVIARLSGLKRYCERLTSNL
jgi:hypothetical protein